MDEFIKNLPKIELHAHINGSLSNDTLKKLIELKKKTQDDYDLSLYLGFDSDGSLEKCFEKFKLAHELVDSISALKLATECIISEFSNENVVYLELRSTPRSTECMTKAQYLEAIVEQIIECKISHPNIIVKYLPSINISYGAKEAEENYNLFFALRNKYPEIVVGIDLSGDATKGKFSDLKHIFERARADGFRFAIHCAESPDESEILDKLEFMADGDRLGHGTFIDEKNPAIWSAFTSKVLPIEICLTSNVLCRTVTSYEDHHISRFIRKFPIVICTDDYAVFSTSLTRELQLSVDVYKLSKQDLIDLMENANKFSFARPHERQLIGDKIREFKLKSFSS
ncbi:hypothetical protein PVAND_008083 [Polypedilum vanderplanki]|uniref:Adenosine deaminase domain-containing protein n=1 Tax=Polypedilum vanderplanki TaxID=319348 RepID=A0A9J6C956_POLVA|nr:hypothetical protein PVAND_008083 [Polypedilum vanderplanki]